MNERKIVAIITIILLVTGIFLIFVGNDFNFYKSELEINENQIKETLYFDTNKKYHTLYRDFSSPLLTQESLINSVTINSVSCFSGESYIRDYYGNCFDKNLNKISCKPYTEENEYGCTFGNYLGFEKNKEYQISANYILSPKYLFEINGKNYIKFIAYSENRHPFLTKNSLKINSEDEIIRKSFYFPKEEVIIYIEYNGPTNEYKITKEDKFNFDSSLMNLMSYLLLFAPALIFFTTWYFFGRENAYKEIPKQLSFITKEMEKRKPWQVSSYFNPPLGKVDDKLFSSIMLYFYHKKIIDVRLKEGFLGNKKLFVKITKKEIRNLDKVEEKVLEILKSLEEEKGKFFELSASFSTRYKLKEKSRELKKLIKEDSKEFLEDTGSKVSAILSVIFLIASFFIFSPKSIAFIWTFIVLMGLVNSFTAIFTRHKKNYYLEYQHWQAFKKYLSKSFSIKKGDHKSVILWEEYLLYATALGVSEKVIKELKKEEILTPSQERLYLGIRIASSTFASSAGASNAGGGAGGGGVGGGGGGGR